MGPSVDGLLRHLETQGLEAGVDVPHRGSRGEGAGKGRRGERGERTTLLGRFRNLPGASADARAPSRIMDKIRNQKYTKEDNHTAVVSKDTVVLLTTAVVLPLRAPP